MPAVLEQLEQEVMRLKRRMRDLLTIIDDRERPHHERMKIAQQQLPMLRELCRE